MLTYAELDIVAAWCLFGSVMSFFGAWLLYQWDY